MENQFILSCCSTADLLYAYMEGRHIPVFSTPTWRTAQSTTTWGAIRRRCPGSAASSARAGCPRPAWSTWPHKQHKKDRPQAVLFCASVCVILWLKYYAKRQIDYIHSLLSFRIVCSRAEKPLLFTMAEIENVVVPVHPRVRVIQQSDNVCLVIHRRYPVHPRGNIADNVPLFGRDRRIVLCACKAEIQCAVYLHLRRRIIFRTAGYQCSHRQYQRDDKNLCKKVFPH